MEEGRASAPARETMSTADLDNRGLLQLQQDTMSRQDNELEELERSVNSTKVHAWPALMPSWATIASCPALWNALRGNAWSAVRTMYLIVRLHLDGGCCHSALFIWVQRRESSAGGDARARDIGLTALEYVMCALQHIALTVNEELDLHRRLLDDLDEDVDVTHSRMRAAQKKLKHVMRRAGTWRSMCFMILLMVILAVVIIVAFKLASFFH